MKTVNNKLHSVRLLVVSVLLLLFISGSFNLPALYYSCSGSGLASKERGIQHGESGLPAENKKEFENRLEEKAEGNLVLLYIVHTCFGTILHSFDIKRAAHNRCFLKIKDHVPIYIAQKALLI